VVLEVLVLGLAALATVILLVRGPLTDAGEIDPLAIVAPIALAVAGAVLLRRLLPVPLLALQRRARRGAHLVGFVGYARAVREPVGAAATLALVVAVAVAVFSSVMLSTISAGTASAVRAELGGDVRVDGPPADAEALAAIAALPGVAAVAGV